LEIQLLHSILVILQINHLSLQVQQVEALVLNALTQVAQLILMETRCFTSGISEMEQIAVGLDKVKAKDGYGAESEWSDPLPISMPKNKLSSIDSLFLRLLERFLEHFPLLGRLLP